MAITRGGGSSSRSERAAKRQKKSNPNHSVFAADVDSDDKHEGDSSTNDHVSDNEVSNRRGCLILF